jgi:hypothetical protein
MKNKKKRVKMMITHISPLQGKRVLSPKNYSYNITATLGPEFHITFNVAKQAIKP